MSMKEKRVFKFACFFLFSLSLSLRGDIASAYVMFEKGNYEKSAELFAETRSSLGEVPVAIILLEAESYLQSKQWERLRAFHSQYQALIYAEGSFFQTQWEIYGVWISLHEKSWNLVREKGRYLLEREDLSFSQRAEITYCLALGSFHLKKYSEAESFAHQSLLFAPFVSVSFSIEVLDLLENILPPSLENSSLNKERLRVLRKKISRN